MFSNSFSSSMNLFNPFIHSFGKDLQFTEYIFCTKFWVSHLEDNKREAVMVFILIQPPETYIQQVSTQFFVKCKWHKCHKGKVLHDMRAYNCYYLKKEVKCDLKIFIEFIDVTILVEYKWILVYWECTIFCSFCGCWGYENITQCNWETRHIHGNVLATKARMTGWPEVKKV